jgi:hypothetical protein
MPLGPYPQLRLYGQMGTTPKMIKTKMTNNNVLVAITTLLIR